jgi:hypothetical protein
MDALFRLISHNWPVYVAGLVSAILLTLLRPFIGALIEAAQSRTYALLSGTLLLRRLAIRQYALALSQRYRRTIIPIGTRHDVHSDDGFVELDVVSSRFPPESMHISEAVQRFPRLLIALILKAHLLGKDPLDIVGNLRPLRQFAGHARMGGGYSAVDMALHDIAGKVYNVPAYRLLGPKLRDKIRIYADTTDHKDPKVYAERMRKRKEMGLTYFKMDLHTELVAERAGAVNERGVATEKGLGYLCEFIEAIRDVIWLGDNCSAKPSSKQLVIGLLPLRRASQFSNQSACEVALFSSLSASRSDSRTTASNGGCSFMSFS